MAKKGSGSVMRINVLHCFPFARKWSVSGKQVLKVLDAEAKMGEMLRLYAACCMLKPGCSCIDD